VWPKPEPPSNDVVTPSINTRALWVREDVLSAIGWGFTPMAEIKENTIDKGIRPTYEDLKLSPEIDSPEKFRDFLRAIEAADLKSMDGQDVIPFSMIGWETWHLGVMFDWGYWRINRAGEVDGYLGLPGAHDYMRWLWTAYREGLIDPDYLVHQHVQLQEKVATGRIAVGEYVRDSINVFEQLEENIDGATRHFIPFPKQSPDYGFYDPYNPHPYHRTLLNKRLSDDAMQRIADMVDWSYSDEGQEILAWGPESAGLYKVVDGRKRFVDADVEEAMLSGDVDGPGAFEYGIYDSKAHGAPDALTKAFGPSALVQTVFTEYNLTSYWPGLMSSVVASDERFLGVSTQLQVANSDQSEVVQGVADWYWGIFPQSYLPQLLKAESVEQFEERFEQLMKAFEVETNYSEAKKNMEAYFAKFPPIWD
jgi:putative aldouronate transport system substrate-binding protein